MQFHENPSSFFFFFPGKWKLVLKRIWKREEPSIAKNAEEQSGRDSMKTKFRKERGQPWHSDRHTGQRSTRESPEADIWVQTKGTAQSTHSFTKWHQVSAVPYGRKRNLIATLQHTQTKNFNSRWTLDPASLIQHEKHPPRRKWLINHEYLNQKWVPSFPYL